MAQGWRKEGGGLCDEELAAALAADLPGSFERLVRAYQGRLYAFALGWVRDPRDAEEIAQDAFVRAYRALAGYPAERVRALALRPWLYRIALNVAHNRRRRRRAPMVSLDRPGDGAAPEPAEDARRLPEAQVELAEQGDELGALVAALPARYRGAVILRHVAGLGYNEAAAVLDQPVGTVKANVHRGTRLLRAALAARRDLYETQGAR